jgi:hypothetical protein
MFRFTFSSISYKRTAKPSLALFLIAGCLLAALWLFTPAQAVFASAPDPSSKPTPAAPSTPQADSTLSAEATSCAHHIWKDPDGLAIVVNFIGPDGDTRPELTQYSQLTLDDGTVINAFCTAMLITTYNDQTFCLSSTFFADWRIAWLISNYPPTPHDRVQNAARQAAVWKLTDNYSVDTANPTKEGDDVDAEVLTAYNAILNSIPDTEPLEYLGDNLHLEVTPPSAINFLPDQLTHPMVARLTQSGLPFPGITLQFSINDSSHGTSLTVTNPVTDADGKVYFSITNTSATAYTAEVTVQASAALVSGINYLHATDPINNQPLSFTKVTYTPVQGQATKTWSPSNSIITIHKFNDSNFNKIQDAGEADLPGWTFALTLPDLTSLTATTDSDGNAYFYDQNQYGLYKIAEIMQPGWVNSTPAELTRVRSQIDSWTQWGVTFGNTHLGRVDVIKVVNWNSQPADPSKTFEICIQGPSFPHGNETGACQTAGYTGKTLSWENLLPGSYTLLETDPGSAWGISNPQSPISVPEGGSASATITNSYNRGSLKVTKSVDWNGVLPDETQTFNICITGPLPATTQNCKPVGFNGGTVTWSDLVPGDYKISEPGADHWTTTITPDEVTILANAEAAATVSIKNTHILARLAITKVVAWGVAVQNPDQKFTICIQGISYPKGSEPGACQTYTSNGGTLTWENIAPGTYHVLETNPGSTWDVQGSNVDILVPDNGADHTVTNTSNLGKLVVHKAVNWNGAITNPDVSFELCITGPAPSTAKSCKNIGANGGDLIWNNLTPGEYSLTETNPDASRWVASGVNVKVTIVSGQIAAPTVTNDYQQGSLKVLKTVDWNSYTNPGPEPVFHICVDGPSLDNVCIDLSGGQEKTWTNLLPGAYTVTEPSAGSNWTVSIPNANATVAVDTLTTVEVTNTFKRGSLKVSKTVDWNGYAGDANTTFQVCIAGPSYLETPGCATLKGGESNTWNDLIPGVYTVTENPGSQWIVQITGDGTVTAGGSATVAVTNKYKRASLDVTKLVDWNQNPVDTSVSFVICIQGDSFPKGNEDGACKTFTAQGGMQTWLDLIPGDYTVTEKTPGPGWAAAGSGVTITVSSNGTSAATITNTAQYGRLVVNKAVNWQGAVPGSNSFQICIKGPSYPDTPNCKSIGATGGDLTWEYLLPGDYTVSETTPDTLRWVVQGSGVTVSVPTGATASSKITNTYLYGKLVVDKHVIWNGVTPTNQNFTLCIKGPSYPGGDCKVIGPQGGSLTWSDLLPGSYTVTEQATGSEWVTQVSGSPAVVPNDGTTATVNVTNTRKLGSLEVTKSVVWNNVNPDANQVFTICIQGPSYPEKNCKPLNYLGGVLTWTDLIPGSYSVSENNPGEDWIITIIGSPASVPSEGGKAVASVKNEHKIPTAVSLLYFRIQSVRGQHVTLSWETASETDNYGFMIMRSDQPDFTTATQAGFVLADVNGATGAKYQFGDEMPGSGKWYYWLVDIDTSGKDNQTMAVSFNPVVATPLAHQTFLPGVKR